MYFWQTFPQDLEGETNMEQSVGTKMPFGEFSGKYQCQEESGCSMLS